MKKYISNVGIANYYQSYANKFGELLSHHIVIQQTCCTGWKLIRILCRLSLFFYKLRLEGMQVVESGGGAGSSALRPGGGEGEGGGGNKSKPMRQAEESGPD